MMAIRAVRAHVLERLALAPTSRDSVDGPSFQVRVRLFATVMLVGTVFLWGVGLWARLVLDGTPFRTLVLDRETLRHAVTLSVCVFATALLSIARLSRREVLVVDVSLVTAFAVSMLASVALRPAAMRPELTALLNVVVMLVARAVIVPSTARRTLALGVVAVAPLFVLGPVFFDGASAVAGIPQQRLVRVTVFAFGSAAIALSTMTSKILYDLRRSVAAATRLGPYELGEKLGQGGMGTVYAAQHTLLRRRTALKLLKPSRHDARSEARFEREARLTGELDHPNTVALFDYGRTPDGIDYYAMEYVDGLTLQALVREQGPLPAGRALGILRQVAAALAQAHARGLIHRDIKGANVMLCHREGHPDCVKVLDFGLAERLVASSEHEKPTAEAMVGTPEYMAPEAVFDPDHVGPAADVYAVGVLGYFLLTGALPFQERDLGALARAHRDAPPLWPSLRSSREIPIDLERVLLRCLSKRPTDRFVDGHALLRALSACTDDDSWSDDAAERWWTARTESPRSSSTRDDDARSVEAERPTRPDASAPSTTLDLVRRKDRAFGREAESKLAQTGSANASASKV